MGISLSPRLERGVFGRRLFVCRYPRYRRIANVPLSALCRSVGGRFVLFFDFFGRSSFSCGLVSVRMPGSVVGNSCAFHVIFNLVRLGRGVIVLRRNLGSITVRHRGCVVDRIVVPRVTRGKCRLCFTGISRPDRKFRRNTVCCFCRSGRARRLVAMHFTVSGCCRRYLTYRVSPEVGIRKYTYMSQS